MTEKSDSPRVRRLCISVDLERYSRWSSAEQGTAQRGLDTVLDQISLNTQPPRSSWTRQPAGDGELAVLPPGVDEGAVISDFVRGLNAGLYRHNRPLNEHARLRLRVAVHAGMTQVSELGFVGQAPVFVARLRDCAQVRQVLSENPDADFAVVISQPLYDDHVGHEYPDFNAGSFRRIRVDMPEKDFVADAWVHVPLSPAPRMDAPPATKTARTGQAPTDATEPSASHNPGSSGVYVSGGTLTADVVAGRDYRAER